MMQCPSCSSQLVAGEARCGVCQALVNPPVAGASALAPRLVTPQSLEGLRGPAESQATPSPASFGDFGRTAGKEDAGKPDPGKSDDEAWRREVLERVRKRRHARRHALPLFGEGNSALDSGDVAPDESAAAPEASLSPGASAPESLVAFDGPLSGSPSAGASNDLLFDLPLRPPETEADPMALRSRSFDAPSQAYVERSRPTLVGGPYAQRSLVADLPLVEPSARPAEESVIASVIPAPGPQPAAMSDRIQAALIDLAFWGALNVTAFYFASRIVRTSILGLGSAWQGLALFGLVLAASYILFFGGLSGATPGKIACGIHVRRSDGSPLDPLSSLARGFLGLLGIACFGLGVWPAFWDKQGRTLHDRATDSRVFIV